MRDYAVNDRHFPDLVYRPQDEVVVSTRPTLRAHPGVLVIVAVQPFLTLLAALVSICLYKIPIGKGFGLVSILSGVDRSSLDLLQDAGFSGKLSDKVALQISSSPVRGAAGGFAPMRINYMLSTNLRYRAVTARLRRKTDYR
jgi:hypothetical protein